MTNHSYRPEDAPYKDPAWLKQKYHVERWSLHEIGDECGVTAASVQYQMDKHDIPTRASNLEKPPTFYTDKEGYERVSCCSTPVYVHRLMAVAEFGFDAVAGIEVHHETNVPWDNRFENFMLMTKSQHSSWHNTQ
jgi:hypothetical protein